MAVTSFASAAQTTPEGMTLVGILSNNTDQTNTGNTRYVNAALKQNTQYVFRYYPYTTTSATVFPAIYYYKSSTGAYATMIASRTTTAGNVFEDRVYYNTQANITQIMFDTTISQATGFIAIYEQAISKPANFFPSDLFVNSSYTWNQSLRAPRGGLQLQLDDYVYSYLELNSGTCISRSNDGQNWSGYGALGAVNGNYAWGMNVSLDPNRRFWSTSGSSSDYGTVSNLWYSDNLGSSWTQKQVSHPTNDYNTMLPPAYSPVLGGRLFTFRQAAGGSRSMYSTDNGATWTTQSGPYTNNQGYGVDVIGTEYGWILLCDYNYSGSNYLLYKTTNGTTFTSDAIASAPGNDFGWYDGRYKIRTSGGTLGFLGVRHNSTSGYYLTYDSSLTLGYNFISMPQSTNYIMQTKNFWISYNQQATTGNTYYTAPIIYDAGQTIPRPPATWTTRTNSTTTNLGPLPGFKAGTDPNIYFARNDTTTTNGAKTTVSVAGFTPLA